MPSLAVESPSRSRRPSPSCRALHHPQFAIAPSIAAHRHCAHGPPPPRSHRPSPSRSRCTVHCHRGAVARAVHCCRRRGAVALSIAVAVDEPSRRPSPSRSRCAIHCRRGAVAPYLAIKEQLSGWLSRLLASHAATSHLPAPPPLTLIAPSSPLVTPLLLLSLSSSWLTA